MNEAIIIVIVVTLCVTVLSISLRKTSQRKILTTLLEERHGISKGGWSLTPTRSGCYLLLCFDENGDFVESEERFFYKASAAADVFLKRMEKLG